MSCSFSDSPLAVYHMEGRQAIPQGADWDVKLRYLDDAGVAVDFTGGSAVMQIRTDYDSTIILELSTNNGGIVLSDGSGTTANVTLKFTPALTSPLTQYEGIYDLEVTLSGLVYKFLKGRWELDREITK